MIDPLKKVQLHTACDDLGESLGLDKGCSYAQHVLVLSEESLVTSSGSMEAINSSTIQTAQRGTIGLNRTKSDLYLPDRNLHDIQGPIRQSVTVRMITKTAR
ncbi:MAG: hypothetical protein VX527_04280 [Planctomycetota bacterium]|nr:hypothetical protein [Planctomycetota bacterium]